MKQDVRAPFDHALDRVRRAAFPPHGFVGQESFMTAGEIRRLARVAGIRAGTSVLDVCCGVAGPGRMITRETGCRYLGVDASADALALAGERAAGLGCRFELRRVPPLPPGRFDVVVLLETMLAFDDKAALLGSVSDALVEGGRFAFTLEEGLSLSPPEQAAMPDAETVRLVPLSALVAELGRQGMHVRWLEECTAAHRSLASSMLRELRSQRGTLARELGERAVDDLVRAHALWVEWLGSGRARKFAVVAEATARG